MDGEAIKIVAVAIFYRWFPGLQMMLLLIVQTMMNSYIHMTE
jgi:hypothetical protein